MTLTELKEAQDVASATNLSFSGLIREALQRLKIDPEWRPINAPRHKSAKLPGISVKDLARRKKISGVQLNKHVG